MYTKQFIILTYTLYQACDLISSLFLGVWGLPVSGVAIGLLQAFHFSGLEFAEVLSLHVNSAQLGPKLIKRHILGLLHLHSKLIMATLHSSRL